MKVQITQFAKLRLKEIYQFYRSQANPSVAKKIKNSILISIKSLIINPERGQLEESLIDLELGHRRIITGNHKIVYKITNQIVIITDIFDTRQDPSQINS